MINEFAVIGSPGVLGGADTELGHQIRCWLNMGIKINIVPTYEPDLELIEVYENLGCVYHEPKEWRTLDGLHCISFCNSEFLDNLPLIRKYAKSTTFVNCMTWNFAKEIEMHKKGYIDFHLYQTYHQMGKVSIALKKYSKYRPIVFKPYFYNEYEFICKRPKDKFRFGRVSRADPSKYNANSLWVYEAMTSPILKEGHLLGWSDKIQDKIGEVPYWINTYHERSIEPKEIYEKCDAIIMTTDTYENLPRVGFEAMASGCLLIVDNKGGWKCQVDNGITGWLCNDRREMTYKASRAAFEPNEVEDMVIAAKSKLDNNWGLEISMKSWDNYFMELSKL